MAMVDFTNAKIEPATSMNNPTYTTDVGLNNSILSSSGSIITSGATRTRIVNEQKQLVYLYQGTFTASGTEFRIQMETGQGIYTSWRVYNISFADGDTYLFQVKADLICN